LGIPAAITIIQHLKIIQLAVFIITGLATLVGLEFYGHIHSVRWKVKTLGDSLVFNEVPVPTTISEQISLPQVEVGENIPRRKSERTLFRLSGLLVDARQEVDGDYHLVLQEPGTDAHMVVEIPAGIPPTPEKWWRQIHQSRKTIDSLIGRVGSTAIHPNPPPLIEVTGIGIFDETHLFVPYGTAPNCREIHPVLGVRVK
jgi:hypothetical protein